MVCHCYRESDSVIRIISARKATRPEQKQYGILYEEWLLSDDIITASSVISIAELDSRLKSLRLSEVDTRQVIETYESSIDNWISADLAVVEEAIELRRQAPVRLPLVDALIAASAAINDAILVHRDKHMMSIPSEFLCQNNLGA